MRFRHEKSNENICPRMDIIPNRDGSLRVLPTPRAALPASLSPKNPLSPVSGDTSVGLGSGAIRSATPPH